MLWLKRIFAGLIGLGIFICSLLVIFGSSEMHSKDALYVHAKRLNEAAAIQIPHHFLMSDKMRASNLVLLKKVESGAVLDDAESAEYRAVFQQNLFESQSFLAKFDSELTVIENWRMFDANNIGSVGIMGSHDHHDESARRNYADVERALKMLDGASGVLSFVQRIAAINLVNKSLSDIISHMGVAPHTISLAYRAPTQPWSEEAIGETFETMMKAYKAAQFIPVNGPHYWRFVDQAIGKYAHLVNQVQARVQARATWWEVRIAGRFLALQTLAPQIEEDIPFRR